MARKSGKDPEDAVSKNADSRILCIKYRGADKSLTLRDWKGRHFSSHAEGIAAAETWLDEQPSEFFWVASKS